MIEAKNLHKTYNHDLKELQVLKGINLNIKNNEIVCIAGPSGAGKSTLLHLLGGLDYPTSGSVLFDGDDIYKMPFNSLAALRNKDIGFVFQFYHLFSEFNALENVLLPAVVSARFKRKDAENRARQLLSMVGLAKRLTHRPSELSGGEQQRVAIARALINNPRALLCDEPTGNLDSKTGTQILDILFSLNKEKSVTQVLVTHNEEIAKFCTRTIYLKDGQISKN
ncbi:MAG: lipoprotein-releasing system ATP-binding protein LolD [Candidatus Omnitrophica bacterium CG11_big_fil_rev_8_21_14_0_20_42_13]|uniref:Lipoprotein-releasing system ATP-binding protein LolD n=1 Tax=Candidatus Ghiorseimicrobium undicola TaxID=1974746 RepID=A0A2H0LVY8_9BACT|nr:MAG: lipoprotein-releasing system ATP-binding protein LolD [Candidatus Omnitrophica bacterium CG11_big_fil_rev_8_21_14_0_20_42_13]